MQRKIFDGKWYILSAFLITSAIFGLLLLFFWFVMDEKEKFYIAIIAYFALILAAVIVSAGMFSKIIYIDEKSIEYKKLFFSEKRKIFQENISCITIQYFKIPSVTVSAKENEKNRNRVIS